MTRPRFAWKTARITAAYAAAALWIVVSDVVLFALASDPHRFAASHTAADALFVAATVILLYRALRAHALKNETAMRLLQEQLRAFHLITACDSAVWQARNRQELFDEICRLAVEEGGHRMAWVGLAQNDAEKTILPVARAGFDPGYVDAVRVVWSDSPRGQGPAGICIRTGIASISRFQEADPRLSPWRAAALRAGYLSTMSLPLKQGARTAGALTLYSDRPDAFDHAEAALMERLAQSISYALGHLERSEKERALLENLKTLGHAADSSPMSIMITDERGNIEFVNRKFTETTGYSAVEVLGSNPRILKTGETSQDDYSRLWETISGGRDWKGVLHNRRKNGDTFWEFAVISPVRGEDGRVRHYIAIKEDLTEKRSLEQQLRQAQKIEALGTLAGGVAHDFNNLLTIIEGHCELLTLSGLATDEARDSVAEIRAAAERAAVMTKRLLQFGRKQALHARRVKLGKVVGDSIPMLERLLGEAYSLTVDGASGPVFAHADPGLIEQLLMNLVINARDAMPHGGKIAVALSQAPQNTAPPPEISPAPHGFVRLSVADHGKGIPPGDLPRVFEPFFTTKAPGKGTGLGLSVVDGIVRQHKGWIEVASTVDKGSVFTVHLPRVMEAAEEAPAPPAPTPAGGTERILLVEDDAALRALAARVLRRLGYAVTEAASGPDALAAWEKGPAPFRLLVTDMVMPGGLSGVELARTLRGDDPKLRVVVMSGYNRELPQDAAETDDGFPFLAKPFKPADLARVVRAELDRD